jgi:hypothetical protein
MNITKIIGKIFRYGVKYPPDSAANFPWRIRSESFELVWGILKMTVFSRKKYTETYLQMYQTILLKPS